MSGDFEVGDFLRIYCVKGNPASWKDWMNIFLKEGNLIWVIEEINQSRTSMLGITTQGVLMRLINPENLNRESKESLQIDLDVPITCRGTFKFFDDLIYYVTDDEGDFFYKLYSINPDAFLAGAGVMRFKVEKVARESIALHQRIVSHGETPEQTEVKDIIDALNALWTEHLHDDHLNPGGNFLGPSSKSFFFKDLWEQGHIASMISGEFSEEFRKGNLVFDNIEKYVFNRELDEGFMPENVEGVLPPPVVGTGGGRKKRRKRRKTKKRKSKRKSKRSSKKRKSKKK
jgi:hypothetical protein